MTDREERIREIAYFLWLDAGSPDGEAEGHWLAAEALVGSEPLEDEPAEVETREEPKKTPPTVGVGLALIRFLEGLRVLCHLRPLVA